MAARLGGHSCGGVGQPGKAWLGAAVAVALAAGCATASAGLGPEPGNVRIVRRPESRELVEGMSRSQVEDRVGLLLLRERFGEDSVYVEPQTRCVYIFGRLDRLRQWGCR